MLQPSPVRMVGMITGWYDRKDMIMVGETLSRLTLLSLQRLCCSWFCYWHKVSLRLFCFILFLGCFLQTESLLLNFPMDALLEIRIKVIKKNCMKVTKIQSLNVQIFQVHFGALKTIYNLYLWGLTKLIMSSLSIFLN